MSGILSPTDATAAAASPPQAAAFAAVIPSFHSLDSAAQYLLLVRLCLTSISWPIYYSLSLFLHQYHSFCLTHGYWKGM